MCLILVLCSFLAIQCTEGAVIISKRYAPDSQSREHGTNTSPTARNMDYYFAQDSSECNSESTEQYGYGMNPLTDWQKFVPKYNNYVPNIQSWQMFIPQNNWNEQFGNTNDYQPFPNPDGRPGHRPWNWNPQGWHPNHNQHKPWNHDPPQYNPNHHHHHHQVQHHYPQVKPPGFEEFPDHYPGTRPTTKIPEETPSTVFPITSKPPQVTTGSTTQGGGGDEIFDIDIRSGFEANTN